MENLTMELLKSEARERKAYAIKHMERRLAEGIAIRTGTSVPARLLVEAEQAYLKYTICSYPLANTYHVIWMRKHYPFDAYREKEFVGLGAEIPAVHRNRFVAMQSALDDTLAAEKATTLQSAIEELAGKPAQEEETMNSTETKTPADELLNSLRDAEATWKDEQVTKRDLTPEQADLAFAVCKYDVYKPIIEAFAAAQAPAPEATREHVTIKDLWRRCEDHFEAMLHVESQEDLLAAKAETEAIRAAIRRYAKLHGLTPGQVKAMIREYDPATAAMEACVVLEEQRSEYAIFHSR